MAAGIIELDVHGMNVAEGLRMVSGKNLTMAASQK